MSREDIFTVMAKLQYFERINETFLSRLFLIAIFISLSTAILHYLDYVDTFIFYFVIAISLCLSYLLPIGAKYALNRFINYAELYREHDNYTDEELWHKVNELDIKHEEERPLFLKLENIKKNLLQQTILKDPNIQVKLDMIDKLVLKFTGTNIN